MPTKRGGGSASPACKAGLRKCMVGDVRAGGSLRAIARTCMSDFNRCRSKGRRKTTSGRKGRCLKWASGRSRCLKRAKR